MLTAFSEMSLDDIKAMLTPRDEYRASEEAVAKIADFLRECGYSDANNKIFNMMCRLGASELEKTSLRGLFIKGDVGVGKTIGLGLLSKYLGWEVVTAKEVEGYYKTQPTYEAWKSYCRACDFFGRPKTLVIDDLGTEDFPFIFYGQQANPLTDLLEIRYRISFQRDKTRTIVTCNLPDEDFKARYGFRIYDRRNEMFAVTTIRGESMRK
jgi:DNA replication protein DnaC